MASKGYYVYEKATVGPNGYGTDTLVCFIGPFPFDGPDNCWYKGNTHYVTNGLVAEADNSAAASFAWGMSLGQLSIVSNLGAVTCQGVRSVISGGAAGTATITIAGEADDVGALAFIGVPAIALSADGKSAATTTLYPVKKAVCTSNLGGITLEGALVTVVTVTTPFAANVLDSTGFVTAIPVDLTGG